MKLLVVHAWLRGNLGDVLQASVLLRSLRELRPSVLDLAGYPGVARAGTEELLSLADRHVRETFAWSWRFVPRAVRRVTLEPGRRKRRAALFSGYDAIVSAPGPFLARYDARWPSALSDLEVAADLGIPFLLASHSIGPLAEDALATLGRASLCVAREATTHAYLTEHGLPSVPSADYAFLYPFEAAVGRVPPCPLPTPYRLLFLRANNLDPKSIHIGRGRLRCGGRELPLAPEEKVVLATSDVPADGHFLEKLAARLGVPSVPCRSVGELVSIVAGSSGVISDRYHPAICAVGLGKPACVLDNREPHKTQGLQTLIKDHRIEGLEALAKDGLSAIRRVLTGALPSAVPA